MNTIASGLGRRNPERFVLATPPHLKALNERYPVTINSDTFVGIEIECERAGQHKARDVETNPVTTLYNIFDRGWERKEDGSLRHQGVEFVTPVGITAADASQLLPLLEDIFKAFYARIQAGPRCGVHIHVNCVDRTYDQVAAFAALYVVFEKSLFKFTGNRVNNNFCVPVRHSNNALGSVFRAVLAKDYGAFWQAVDQCPKYMAFNIGALHRFGTIEFRHAQGTATPTTIVPWLKTIVQMLAYASTQDLTSLVKRLTAINTTCEYEPLAREIFPPEFIDSVGLGSIREDMKQGCSMLKECLIPPEDVREQDDSWDDDGPQRPTLRGVQDAPPREGGFRVNLDGPQPAVREEDILQWTAGGHLPPEPEAPVREFIPVRRGSRWEPRLTNEMLRDFIRRREQETVEGIRPRQSAVTGRTHRAQTDANWGPSSRVQNREEF